MTTKNDYQKRVGVWMMACFGAEISGDRVERGDRLLEEVLELLQASGYDPARVDMLRNYVWSKPVGEPEQEMGGVMVTLAAYGLAHDLDMHEAGEVELGRVWGLVETIRAKQLTKPKGSPLPVEDPVRCDYCKENGFQAPNLCEDCRAAPVQALCEDEGCDHHGTDHVCLPQGAPTTLERNLAVHYLTTHGDAIRRALQHLHDTEVDADDRAYYAHELKAFDEVVGK